MSEDPKRINSQNIALKRLLRIQKEVEPIRRPLPTWYAGRDADGLELVQVLGQDPVPIARSVSTGAMGIGDRVCRIGSSIDITPHIKPAEVAIAKVERKTSTIKFLFGVTNGSQTKLFIGGFQASPVLVGSFPAGSIYAAILDNLGGDRWSVDLVLNNSGSYAFQQIRNSGSGEAIAIPTPSSLALYGSGFAKLTDGYPNFSDLDRSNYPTGTSSYSTSGGSSFSSTYLVNGAIATVTGSISYSQSNEYLGTISVGGGSPSPYWQVIYSSNGTQSTPLNNVGSYSRSSAYNYQQRVPVTPIGEVQFFHYGEYAYTPIRSNGSRSIGTLNEFSNLPDAYHNDPLMAFAGSAIAPTTIPQSSFGDPFSPPNYDLQDDGFTSFTLDSGAALTGSQAVSVQKYGTDFLAVGAAIAVQTIKPSSVPSGSVTFYNASYHS